MKERIYLVEVLDPDIESGVIHSSLTVPASNPLDAIETAADNGLYIPNSHPIYFSVTNQETSLNIRFPGLRS